jgi:hypothetical protein
LAAFRRCGKSTLPCTSPTWALISSASGKDIAQVAGRNPPTIRA